MRFDCMYIAMLVLSVFLLKHGNSCMRIDEFANPVIKKMQQSVICSKKVDSQRVYKDGIFFISAKISSIKLSNCPSRGFF